MGTVKRMGYAVGLEAQGLEMRVIRRYWLISRPCPFFPCSRRRGQALGSKSKYSLYGRSAATKSPPGVGGQRQPPREKWGARLVLGLVVVRVLGWRRPPPPPFTHHDNDDGDGRSDNDDANLPLPLMPPLLRPYPTHACTRCGRLILQSQPHAWGHECESKIARVQSNPGTCATRHLTTQAPFWNMDPIATPAPPSA